MTFKIFDIRIPAFILFTIIFFASPEAQTDKSTLKAQIAVGLNQPSVSGFVSGFEAKPVNFPTINLGLQYQFSSMLGAKFDLGYNRFSNKENTRDFKVNATRLNLQLVYDASQVFNQNRFGLFLHAGPGITMIKPLGNFPENKTSYFNIIGGAEFHYGLSDTMSVFLDASYIAGFAKDFDPITSGYGSFNGNLTTVSIGLSFSLSGCYFCEQR
ncbi:outer membrane beta-barrel protein [Gaetbulibacter sp. M240]|uniref:outer membrane beta-barrel protein n=1 Tax=Gaetbulibacter sp. M240 TaxID=3126511 RepID=UPI00374E4BA5